ncbi:Unspecific monooxygenase [halophilic archaeon DL31]|jgi:cytochrome P450|nr:Unspecific monooxygenase [halophilic archaeon DL31]
MSDLPERPPGPDGWPVVGSFPEYARDAFAFETRLAREYGPLTFYSSLGRGFYQVNDPELIETVLVHQNQSFGKGELFHTIVDPVGGDGLLTAEGEQWRRQRHMANPAFHPDRIAEYSQIMVEETEALLSTWDDSETVNVHEEMMEVTLDIVTRALFGMTVDDGGAIADAMDVVMERVSSPISSIVPEWAPTPGNREFFRAIDRIDAVVDAIIEHHRNGKGREDSVLAALLAAQDEEGEGMDDELVRDEVRTLLLAGHETTALALTFTLFCLAQNPAAEDRLVGELETVLEGERPTMADARSLEYTEQVVDESMRLYPPVHGILREANEDVDLGGYTVPAGATVSLNQWTVHRDERFYDDPMVFDPSRWTDELKESLPRFAYFPFSGGSRRCVGDRFAKLEAKLVLATLYQDRHFELVSEPQLSLSPSITTRPTEPVLMRVHER